MIGEIAIAVMGAFLLWAFAKAAWERITKGSQMVPEDAAVYERHERRGFPRPYHENGGNLDEHHDYCWRLMTVEQKRLAVEHLRSIMSPDDLRDIALIARGEKEEPVGFHMFGGMGVRNALRNVIQDSELPAVPYPHGFARNWDDFYWPALECAAGVREL